MLLRREPLIHDASEYLIKNSRLVEDDKELQGRAKNVLGYISTFKG
jgi:hypothetical protein